MAASPNDIIELVKQNILHQLRAGLPDGVDDDTEPTPVPAATLKEAVNLVRFLEARGKGGEGDELKKAIEKEKARLKLADDTPRPKRATA